MGICWLCVFGLIHSVATSSTVTTLIPRGRISVVATIALVTIVGTSMYMGGKMIQTRVGSVDQMGASMLTTAYGAMAINLAVFFTCLAVIQALHPSKEALTEKA